MTISDLDGNPVMKRVWRGTLLSGNSVPDVGKVLPCTLNPLAAHVSYRLDKSFAWVRVAGRFQ